MTIRTIVFQQETMIFSWFQLGDRFPNSLNLIAWFVLILWDEFRCWLDQHRPYGLPKFYNFTTIREVQKRAIDARQLKNLSLSFFLANVSFKHGLASDLWFAGRASQLWRLSTLKNDLEHNHIYYQKAFKMTLFQQTSNVHRLPGANFAENAQEILVTSSKKLVTSYTLSLITIQHEDMSAWYETSSKENTLGFVGIIFILFWDKVSIFYVQLLVRLAGWKEQKNRF